MNVTNRRKSTDADTTPTTQTQHNHSLHQQHQPLLAAYISCRQAATTTDRHNRTRQVEDQEQVVTSTSADCLLPLQAEGEGEEIAIELDAIVTSPARITSSTNDNLSNNSVDSLSLEEMVMPTTSENARLETEKASIHQGININNRSTKTSSNDTIERDNYLKSVVKGGSVAGSAGVSAGRFSLSDLDGQSTSTSNSTMDSFSHGENHKIILKLPRPSAASESQTITVNEGDLRKVEPLKINLHNTHHYHHTPKITIKPIVKDHTSDALGSSEECSSSAEDELVSKLSNSEPHIIPKLTIRSKNEDYGFSQTTVVPKLTIKINDSTTDSLSAPPAANTPPLPKLTIKTGQDGHSESIITNVSPASSTNSSSSSLASSSATSSSSTNFLSATSMTSIPKLTIKPLQKLHVTKSGEEIEHPPTIPKLCIKANMLSTDVTEESTGSKIPKLTIKTSQEHAVIITQHSENIKAMGIPKLTIKTKCLDAVEDTNVVDSIVVEKVPKLTIKTSSVGEISKLCRNKAQQEVPNDSSIIPMLSPKQPAVPKLTISRQTNHSDREVHVGEAAATPSIPKMTIKTQNKLDYVPKVILKKSTANRPSSTEESGISDDPEEEHGGKTVECNKIVPKLTIKNLGSPKQRLKVVVDNTMDLNRVKNQTPASNAAENESTNNAEEVDEFNDLLNADNGGGESSNSQEFCGFNENMDGSDKSMVVVTSITTNAEDAELRRHSDDMDIDESLQIDHEPEMFQNAAHFITQNSISNCSPSQETGQNGNVALNVYAKMGHIIDTVDLTSSAGSSPARRFDYNDDEEESYDNAVTEPSATEPSGQRSETNILLERLQRETSVIQNTQQLQNESNSSCIPPPLQPKPNTVNKSAASLKYPQLAERLMSNGLVSENVSIPTPQDSNCNSEQNIIDSIEILDTPEGSPRHSLDERPDNVDVIRDKSPLSNGLHNLTDSEQISSNNNNNFNLKRHATTAPPNKETSDKDLKSSDKNSEELPHKVRKIYNNSINISNADEDDSLQSKVLNSYVEDPSLESNCFKKSNSMQPSMSNHQRLRKQKHEHLLPLPMDEMHTNSNDSFELQTCNSNDTNENVTPLAKRRGRPKKSELSATIAASNVKEDNVATPASCDNKQDCKSRRVQLLRKRLAIDMVDASEPTIGLSDVAPAVALEDDSIDPDNTDVPRKERGLRTPLRTSRRSNTPTAFQIESKIAKNKASTSLAVENQKSSKQDSSENVLNQFLESTSSVSSTSSSTLTTFTLAGTSNNLGLSMATQIDLTMSSSSSNSNGCTTFTTVEATTASRQSYVMIADGDGMENAASVSGTGNNSMLPPTTILSSSDPLPDVILRPNDFSSIIAMQQLRDTNSAVDQRFDLNESHDGDMMDNGSGADNSGDDSASSSSMSGTPGRGRGRSRGGRSGRNSGRGHRSHRLSRGASAVAKSIAMNRPRCVGALKHTPDPERLKGLYSPSPQVFEEDTRMSAELTQTNLQQETPLTPLSSQPDFLANDESQSSMISNTSILDPNNVLAVQSGSAVKKTVKKKKMEVCVAEEDFTVASIAEYDWPPPKGCCPSKNRDTFMIQEQIAMYLGIKSFKRKYPDLPRRQVDMEERNWLQEKGLVSEKMCDLGITAVWASDILDIMYTDFYDKYEEYKDFVRQKHLREIEAKQKSLGLNVAGKGLQARERAMLSTSKWNTYLNRTRKNERLSCLDLQTLIINKPSPAAAPISTIALRPIAETVAFAAKSESIPQPPTLLQPRVCEPLRLRDVYYPLSLVPGQFCEKYCEYSCQELRCFPLNTVIDYPFSIMKHNDDNTNSSDTDSAIESIDNKDDVAEASNTSMSKRICKRRVRRMRYVGSSTISEFKIPPIPGASNSTTSSTDTYSSSDESSSETDSDSTCTSSSLSEESSDEEDLATCGVCTRPQNRNLNDIPELFVQCYTCRRKVHPSCIEMPSRMATRVRNYNWQCAGCKCCIKCKRNNDINKMLFCEQCDRGFHIYCLGIKAVPDGRWSCDRCCICMRCGATKPDGLPLAQQQIGNSPNGERIKQVKHKKVKWINEYRLDHITKLREHCSMLCVPCGRMKTAKRVQIATYNNTTYLTSPGSNSALSPSCSNSSSNSISNTATTVTTSAPEISPSSLIVTSTSTSHLAPIETTDASTSNNGPSMASASSSYLENKDLGIPPTSASGTTPVTMSASSASNTNSGPPPVVA